MSRSVDTKVVEMQFDNKKFEKNAKQSMKTLAKLKQSLKFEDSSDKIDDLQKSLDNVSFKELDNSLDSVEVHFSLLEKIKNAFIDRWVNSFADAAKRTAKSLSTDQLSAGWNKYEQQTVAIRTIMNSTGKAIDEVEQYMDELSWFSDETSYDVATMTDALGTLTAAGGDIEKMIPFIMGVANATSYAGKGAAEFNRAIYNINQSYGQGYLSNIDYKSLEQAGVGSTKAFKQTLIDAAKAVGTLNAEGKTAKGTIVDIGTLRNTLSEGWANKEVMEKAFGEFAKYSEMAYQMVRDTTNEIEYASDAYAYLSERYQDIYLDAAKSAQETKTLAESLNAVKDAASTQWSNIYKAIFGNTEEATVLWTDLTDKLLTIFVNGFSKWTDPQEGILAGWKAAGGRDNLIAAFNQIWENASRIANAIKSAFRDIFPAKTSSDLLEMTNNFRSFAERIAPTERMLEKIKSTFRGLFAAVDMVGRAFRSVISALWPFSSAVATGVGESATYATSKIGDFLYALNETTKRAQTFEKFGKRIRLVLGLIASVIKVTFDAIKTVFSKKKKDSLASQSEETAKTFEEKIADIESNLDAFAEKIQNVFSKVKAAFGKVSDFVKKAVENLKQAFSKTNNDTEEFAESSEKAGSALQKIWNALAKAFGAVKDAFLSVFKPLKKDTAEFTDSMNENTKSFNEYVETVGKKFPELWNKIKSSGIVEFITKMVNVLSDIIFRFFDIIDWILFIMDEAVHNATFQDLRDTMMDVIGSGLILNISKLFKSIAGLLKDARSFAEFGDTLNTTLKSIKGTIKEYNKEVKVKVIKQVAESLLILAAAMVVISSVDMDRFNETLVGTLGLLLTFVLSIIGVAEKLSKLDGKSSLKISKDGVLMSTSIYIRQVGNMMVKMAASVLILALALKQIAPLFVDCKDNAEIVLYAVGTLMGMMLAMFIMLGVFIKIFTKHINSVLQWDGDAKLKDLKQMFVRIGTMLLLMAASVWLIANAVTTIASIGDMNQLLVASGMVILIMAMLFEFASVLSKGDSMADRGGKGFIKIATGILIFGIAMMAMAGAIALIGQIDPTVLDQGLAVINDFILFFSFIIFVFSIVEKETLAITDAAKGFVLMAAGIFLIAVGMIAMAGAIELIGRIDPVIMRDGFGRIGLFTLLFTAMTAVISLANKGVGSKAVSAGAAFLLMAAGVGVMAIGMTFMAGAILALGNIPLPMLVQGFVIAALITGLVTAIVAAASTDAGAMAGGAGVLMLIALGLGALAVSLLAMCAPLAILSKINWEDLGKAGAIIGAIVAVAAVIGAIPGGALAVAAGAASLLVVGAALISMALAVAIFAAAMAGFAIAVDLFAYGITLLAQGESSEAGLKVLTMLLGEIIKFIAQLGLVMLENAVSIFVFAAALGKLFWSGVTAGIGLAATGAGYTALTAALALYAVAANQAARSQERLNAANENKSSKGLGESVINALSSVFNFNKAGKEDGKAYIEGVKNATGIASPSKETKKIGEFLTEGLEKGTSGMKDVGKESGEDVINGVKDTLNLDAMQNALNEGGMNKSGIESMGAEYSDMLKGSFSNIDTKAMADNIDTQPLKDMWNDTELTSPTITPVLDLDTLKNQWNSSNFGQTINGVSSAQLTSATGAFSAGSSSNVVNQGDTISINVFGAQGQDVQELAQEINTILRRQSEQKFRVYGNNNLIG